MRGVRGNRILLPVSLARLMSVCTKSMGCGRSVNLKIFYSSKQIRGNIEEKVLGVQQCCV